MALRYHHLATGRAARAAAATFIPPDALQLGGYGLIASPTLYPGQLLRARVAADAANDRSVSCRLYLRYYDERDQLARLPGPETVLAPGAGHEFRWPIPATGGLPIAEVGIELTSERRADGVVFLDYLTWDGAPDVELGSPAGGNLWRRAWVEGVDRFQSTAAEPYRLIQDEGTGLLIQGTREWTDYRVTARITPHLATRAGLAARVQGLRRYYALLLDRGGKARLVKELDGTNSLAERDFSWQFEQGYQLSLEVAGRRLQAWIDGDLFFDVRDEERPLTGGAVGLLCEEGRVAGGPVRVQPAD